MHLRPSTAVPATDWLFDGPRSWQEKTFGPTGFEAYSRLRFPVEPTPGATELWQLAVAVQRLTRHTTTPELCYFLIWDGWPPRHSMRNVSDGARMELVEGTSRIPDRGYHLFEGYPDLFAWQDDRNYPGTPPRALPDPAFIWPADRAWFIADDVDPDYASVGASAAAIADLLQDYRIDTVRVRD